ncbi:hypothetical protein BV898_06817 [Hypsibius exemplaris]|uniref:Uncharacterized protein n=1 Tax=Hypsibius exemplaris TaxID=2072580 RepID=A0A1W0WVH2_HYPEX|nr:hypothetical protein BV898_06817 [Hypsibius exemplaris]
MVRYSADDQIVSGRGKLESLGRKWEASSRNSPRPEIPRNFSSHHPQLSQFNSTNQNGFFNVMRYSADDQIVSGRRKNELLGRWLEASLRDSPRPEIPPKLFTPPPATLAIQFDEPKRIFQRDALLRGRSNR